MTKPEPRPSNLSGRRRGNHPAIPVEARHDATEQATNSNGNGGVAAPAAAKRTGRPKGTGSNRDTTSQTITVTTSILEEARNAVAYLKENPTAPRSFTSMVDLALYKLIHELRDEYNNGQPFPQREGHLKPGPK